MARARLVMAVVALQVGLWGPQQPPEPANPTRAAEAWPGS
jgi:hypothetical protein